jgi:starch synthase (maltosyl-transferring)
VNQIRRAHRALQSNDSLRFHATDNPEIIAYSKTSPDGDQTLLMIVNLDPHHLQHGFVQMPVDARSSLGAASAPYDMYDLLTDTHYVWRGDWNYVRLDPGVRQAHILSVGRG